MNMSMAMYFNNDLNFYLLFEGWMVMNKTALIGSCIGWLLLAFMLEGIKGNKSFTHARGHAETFILRAWIQIFFSTFVTNVFLICSI